MLWETPRCDMVQKKFCKSLGVNSKTMPGFDEGTYTAGRPWRTINNTKPDPKDQRTFVPTTLTKQNEIACHIAQATSLIMTPGKGGHIRVYQRHSRTPRGQAGSVMLTAAQLLLLLLLRLSYVLLTRGSSAVAPKRARPARTLVVLGSGGHTAEMASLLRSLSPAAARYRPLTFVTAATDALSEARVRREVLALPAAAAGGWAEGSAFVRIPRSREVGQSWLTTVFATLRACLSAVAIVLRCGPDVLLCNGPGTCIPLVVAVLLRELAGLGRCQLVFVESMCRVETLSLSGKIMYRAADKFVVHWEALAKKYPRAVFVGRLV